MAWFCGSDCGIAFLVLLALFWKELLFGAAAIAVVALAFFIGRYKLTITRRTPPEYNAIKWICPNPKCRRSLKWTPLSSRCPYCANRRT